MTIKHVWTKSEITENLERFYSNTGFAPRSSDVKEMYNPCSKIWGSYEKALAEVLPGVAKRPRRKSTRCPFTESEINLIMAGEFTSRRAIYKAVGGRSKEKIRWLNDNNVLMPTKYTKEDVIRDINDLCDPVTGHPPKVQDAPSWLVARAQRRFGSWNEAVFAATGYYNQKRYSHISDDDLLTLIRSFSIMYQRLPLRQEFDGDVWPYFEAYFTRFGLSRWSDVIALVDLSDLTLYAKFGWGAARLYDGKLYLSHEELAIGKYLTKEGIAFDKEVPYGQGSNAVFDFYLPEFDLYVEYYGLETEEYQRRTEKKRSQYGNRNVLEIFKHDNTIDKLASEVQRLQLPLVA